MPQASKAPPAPQGASGGGGSASQGRGRKRSRPGSDAKAAVRPWLQEKFDASRTKYFSAQAISDMVKAHTTKELTAANIKSVLKDIRQK